MQKNVYHDVREPESCYVAQIWLESSLCSSSSDMRISDGWHLISCVTIQKWIRVGPPLRQKWISLSYPSVPEGMRRNFQSDWHSHQSNHIFGKCLSSIQRILTFIHSKVQIKRAVLLHKSHVFWSTCHGGCITTNSHCILFFFPLAAIQFSWGHQNIKGSDIERLGRERERREGEARPFPLALPPQ